jgi:hypothetical protein
MLHCSGTREGKKGEGESKHFFFGFSPKTRRGKKSINTFFPNTQGSREREHTSNIDTNQKVKNERKSLNMTFFGILLEGTILYPMLVLP